MKRVLSIVTGFVTNSSSVIHGFDRAVLQDPRVQALMDAYDVRGGFIGPHLGSRSHCTSLIMTPEQQKEATERFVGLEYGGFNPGFAEDMVYCIYGDEYESLASELCHIMREVADKKKLAQTSQDFH